MPPSVQRLCVDGIGPERQLVRFGGVAQRIEHDAGLHARESADRIDLEDPVHVLREVEHDRHVAALSGEAGARAARQDGRVVLPARGHRRDHIVGIAGNDEADRNLAVVRAVGRVERAAAAIEPHLAADHPLQLALELGGLSKRIDRFCVRAEREGARVGRRSESRPGVPAVDGRRLRTVRRAGASESSAAITPPGRYGTPAIRRPISMPLSVPASIRSLKLPR